MLSAVLAVSGVFAQTTCIKELPNLIYSREAQVGDGVDVMFRPETINIDGVTIRDILNCNGVTVTDRLIVQVIRVTKVTPYLKCTAFVTGPGAGLNTNFDSGNKKATNLDLDKSVVKLAFGIPQDQVALGVRSLLFSPPGTTYTISVTYVVLDANGRPGVPVTVTGVIKVIVPDRARIWFNIEYFSTVAAGATQKPKIDGLAVRDLLVALKMQDDLSALIAFETAVATYAIDFKHLLALVDDRFYHDYLIDGDEEPIGCLLVEMANAALWH